MRKRSVGSPAVCSFVVAVAADSRILTPLILAAAGTERKGTCQDSDCEATVVHYLIPSTALALTRYSMRSSRPLKPPLIRFVTALTSSSSASLLIPCVSRTSATSTATNGSEATSPVGHVINATVLLYAA